MSLHDVLADLGTDTGEQVLTMWRRWQRGEMTEAEFRTVARAILTRADARAAALADTALMAALTALRREVVPAVGLEAAGDAPGAAGAAVGETLASESYRRDPEAAVAVLGSAFAYQQFQSHYGAAMRAQGVTYWQRVPDAGACEVCQDLSEGVVSADVPMWHHKGCMCVAQPINV